MSNSVKVVRVVNANSNEAVTAAMSEALEPLRSADGPRLDCVTLAEAPIGIQSLADVATVEPMLRDLVAADDEADAFVMGCYSDPGLFVCREVSSRPVFGIQQCAALAAIARGGRFGVLSLSASAVERHLRYLATLGLREHCAGDRPVGLTVAESEGAKGTFDKLVGTGTALRDSDGARALILGCTGMARHRAPLEEALGIPVIEPTQAATAMAITAVKLGW